MLYDAKYGAVTLENTPESVKDHTEEPVFVLRAQDAFSVPMLARYKNFAIEGELPDSFVTAIDDVISSFRDWQKDNTDRVKVPDNHGEES